uniref:Cyclin-like domain-containing protein n=1 Tax=Pyxicephalus adspersus TaxID=30357 RepID=A0AAV3ARP4_PYXAD|nr:TPA: hypothetical protein GDO54_011302 [Pyxicephalus adspersus]
MGNCISTCWARDEKHHQPSSLGFSGHRSPASHATAEARVKEGTWTNTTSILKNHNKSSLDAIFDPETHATAPSFSSDSTMEPDSDTNTCAKIVVGSSSSPSIQSSIESDISNTMKTKACDLNCSLQESSKEDIFAAIEGIDTENGLEDSDRVASVDWMIRTYTKLELNFKSLCLAVNILDQVLDYNTMDKNIYKVMAAASFLTAAIICECDPSQLTVECCKQYSSEKLLTMQEILMKTLKYESISPTLNEYLGQRLEQRLYSLEVVTKEELCKFALLKKAAKAVAAVCLTDRTFCSCPPKVQAIVSIAVAELHLYPEAPLNIWDTEYSENVLQVCLENTYDFLSKKYDYVRSLLKAMF